MNYKLSTSKYQSQSTRILLLGIWGHLSGRRRIQLGLLLLVMLASGLAELISLGAVLPFLAMLSDPQLLWQNSLVQELAPRVGFIESSQLLIPATLGFVFTILIAAMIRLLNLWLNGRLAAAIGSDLSCEAYRRTLLQPYEIHMQRNSSEVITATTTQISITVGAINNLLQLLTSSVVAIALLSGLLIIDAPVALCAAALFGVSYVVLAVRARRQLQSNGQKIAHASSDQLRALQEGLGAIRDVLLDGSQLTYLETYRRADRQLRLLDAKNGFLGAFPRYTLEAVGMISIALLGALLVIHRGSGGALISLLGVLALGAQRLLPALQQIYSGWATLKGYNKAIEIVIEMLNQPVPKHISVPKPLPLKKSIRFESVCFSYKSDGSQVLRGVNLEILSGERIGLIGSTGSGKSTIIDLFMALLVPTSGRILIDGVNLHDTQHPERIAAWRAAIAHVPQNVYLSDNSVAENIAFGIPKDEIDFSRVRDVATQAQIASFIESNPESYYAFVGERGVRLSGGQRQRIGIARALYKGAKVLVFDEATSALDNETEFAVMNSIEGLSRDLTIFTIAHRLSTLKSCDRVIKLEDGLVAHHDLA